MSNSNETHDMRQYLTLVAVGVIVFLAAHALGHLTQALTSTIGL